MHVTANSQKIVLDISTQHEKKVHDKYKQIVICIYVRLLFE